MKRWILKAGVHDLDALVEQTVDRPEPGPGEVRVRVYAASLNFRDQLTLADTTGRRRVNLDLVPLSDGAGVIDALGDGVSEWAVGDRVISVFLKDFEAWPPHAAMGMGLGASDEHGMLAEYVVLRADRLTRAPANLCHLEAATLPCAALTAWTALQEAYPVQPGQKVLTLGTGGVSLFALAFAKALGAEVFVTTSRDDKRERLLALGATAVFNYASDHEWGTTIFAATGGVHKVVNTAGLGSLNHTLNALAYGGDIGVIGLKTFGDVIDPAMFMMKWASVRGIAVGSRQRQDAMVRFIEANAVKPVIQHVFDFDEAKAAYAAQLAPDIFGKIVIRVGDG